MVGVAEALSALVLEDVLVVELVVVVIVVVVALAAAVALGGPAFMASSLVPGVATALLTPMASMISSAWR